MHQRRFRRIPFGAQVTIASGQNARVCELIDLAMRGALLASDIELPFLLGDRCSLCITLPGGPISLDFEADLVHHEGNHYGFRFISEDLATLTHLRKLIELNTGDAETTRDELTAWLKD